MGSIRIPSACCGLAGIKPGLGTVPAGLGNGSWFDMSENGPLATTVQDAATMLAVMAAQPRLARLTEPSPMRIAVSTQAPMIATPVDKHWRAVAGETGLLLREAGHSVRADDPPYSQRMLFAELARWSAGTEMDARLLADRSRLEPRHRRWAAFGRLMIRLGRAGPEGRARWQQRAERFFGEHDVLVTPALAQPPIRSIAWSGRGLIANLWSNSHYAPFAAPWNLAGWPAMTVPAGAHPDGTPLAVQLVTRPGGEATLLGLAATLERMRPWERTAPRYAAA
jgi:amidase